MATIRHLLVVCGVMGASALDLTWLHAFLAVFAVSTLVLAAIIAERDRGEAAQEEAAGALYALAEHATNRLEITEAGGIGPLVVLLGCSHPMARKHAALRAERRVRPGDAVGGEGLWRGVVLGEAPRSAHDYVPRQREGALRPDALAQGMPMKQSFQRF